MSSISAVHCSVQSVGWPRSSAKSTWEDLTAHGPRRWNNSNTFFNSGLPTPPGSKVMPGVALGNSYNDFSGQNFLHGREPPQDRFNTSQQHRSSSTSTANGNQFTLTSFSNPSLSRHTDRAAEQDKAIAIAPHLQIPDSVNKSKGSLAEFTAEITCLFWFESSSTLQYAEELPVDCPVDRGLSPDAVPTIGFRKWVTTIISTTQVARNVILLALMFVYRLKRFNPTVSGKPGSEFRLLTIALMLGNKFLDDNTYTNKTWAEVSGISVNEIHIMEVEFLSNMRYALYASAEEWTEWKAKLGRFGAFYDKASRMPSIEDSNGPSPVTPATPASQYLTHKLPSPPANHQSVSPFVSSTSMISHYPQLPQPIPTLPQLSASPLRQQQQASALSHEGRKRSLDTSSELPPAKRVHQPAGPSGHGGNILNALPYPSTGVRMPTGNFSNMANPLPAFRSLDGPRVDTSRVSTPTTQSLDQLAPLSVPGSRAMSSVYPNVSTLYSQPITPVSAMPQNLYQNSIPSLAESSAMSNYPSAHASPSTDFSSTNPAPTGLSPSYFLTHRSSPYRPVRHVNTLLIPPPSAALQLPVRNIPSNQIHYQPLSKTATEPRSGPVPFMQLDPWQHSNVSTPISQHQYPF